MDPQTITAYAVTVLALAAIVAAWIYLRRMLANDTSAAAAAYIHTLVKAAEQQFTSNAERRAWVVAQAREHYPQLPIEIILAVLEAAVYDLNQEQWPDAIEPKPAVYGQLMTDGHGRVHRIEA